ncbi:hypothetical protein [Pseudomonas lurida]|uniref:hypothetical protein n=1 Tax=Pseudomonas lurida TaxID=244566 RepID=UPI001780E853|nr:hypothetical protein [Pseudomonas lurida]MBD8671648.1 hypothetical protein [Pseudomonas lurida]
MAADAKRIMETPLAKLALGIVQTCVAGLLISICTGIYNKLDGILTSINTINKDIALIQSDQRQQSSATSALRFDVDALKKTTYQLEIRVEQMEREKGGSRGRNEG